MMVFRAHQLGQSDSKNTEMTKLTNLLISNKTSIFISTLLSIFYSFFDMHV